MRLIVNADDFGMSRGVNFGILDAFHNGIVRSTTILANGDAFEHAVTLAKENPALGVGVHLNLTRGRPISSGLNTLVDENGNFHQNSQLVVMTSKLDREEVAREFTAQIERVISAGVVPTHLDSHHHIHMLSQLLPVFQSVVQKYGLPVRWRRQRLVPVLRELRHTDSFEGGFHGEDVSLEMLQELLTEHEGDKTVELMCHPAYADAALIDNSSYALPRVRELVVLTAPEILQFVDETDISLISYREF